jgi:uncharacterized protein YbjT (DUF2867 family)
MKVVVFGSTGHTGQQLVEQLVQAGHEVTAFARTPTKVNTFDGKVTVTQGDALDLASIREAVKGQDAVFHALAPSVFKKSDIQTIFANNLVKAMEAEGVKRLIMLSAQGSGDSASEASLMVKFVSKILLKKFFIDKGQAEAIIINSPLIYTLVRPAILLNGKARGGVKASIKRSHLKQSINRADVAAFMIEQLRNSEWERKSPLIGY